MDDEVRKPSFLVYYDNEVIVLRLPDEEAGKLFKSLFPYGREEIRPDFEASPALAMAFDILSMAIDRDKEKYIARCEANRENGRKGGRPKKNQMDIEETEKSERFFSKPKKADKDRDMDKGKHKDNDKQKDNIKNVCSEPEKPAPNPSGILLPLNDKTLYDVPLDKIAIWKDAYPAVNVEQELKRMAAWLESNPTRRKTQRGITKFINIWLAKEQDEGGRFKGSRQQGQGKDRELTPEDYELPPEYQEMYKKHLGKRPPSPDDPFQ